MKKKTIIKINIFIDYNRRADVRLSKNFPGDKMIISLPLTPHPENRRDYLFLIQNNIIHITENKKIIYRHLW